MPENLKAKILNTHDVLCRGVPTYKGLCLAESVAVLLTSHVDGTVEVACHHYRDYNESKKQYLDDRQND